MQSVELHLDEENELSFKVSVEGSEGMDVGCRLVVENEDYSLSFSGAATNDGEILVIVPSLSKVMKEGNYPARLEVLVDDRLFVPLQLSTKFKQSLSVTAESVSSPKRKPSVSASASLLSSATSKTVLENKAEKDSKNSRMSREEVRDMLRREIKNKKRK